MRRMTGLSNTQGRVVSAWPCVRNAVEVVHVEDEIVNEDAPHALYALNLRDETENFSEMMVLVKTTWGSITCI